MDLLSRISNFLAPKATAAGSAGKNTLGMLKDYIEYNTAKNAQDKQKQLIEYNQKRNIANEALKQFGFDANKQGNQFDPVQYGRGTLAGAGELASLYSPMGGGTKARMIVNAVPGITDAMGRGEDLKSTILSGALTSIGGTAGEKLIKGAGALTRGFGNQLVDSAENLGLRNLGLTKLDVNKYLKNTGESVMDVLKKNNLVGRSADAISTVIDPLQKSFNDIAEKSGLQINPNDLLDTFGKKIEELKASNAPELRLKGEQLEKYVTNLFDNPSQDFSGAGITKERRIIDQLVKDFEKSGGDAISSSKNKIIRDVLQEAVRAEAELKGIKGVGEKTLTELGDELKKLYSLSEVASKRSPQPTGNPLGLLKILGLTGGLTTGAFAGGLPGAIIGGGAGLALESAANNPVILKNIISGAGKAANITSKASNIIGSEGAQKLLQILGIGAGRQFVNNVTNVNPNFSNQRINIPSNNNQQDQQTNNNELKIGNIQNSQITPNTQSIAQNTASQEQFDPNMEVTLLDGTKTTYGALQQQGAFQQAEQPQTNMQGLSDDQINQLSLLALISGDTKALQQIQAYQGIKDKINKGTEDKPLSAEQQKLALNAQSALDSLNIVREVSTNGVPATVGLPDYLGGNQAYQAAINNVADTIGRLRSGGAINKDEEIRFMNLLPKFGDNPQTVQFKLNQVEQLLQRFAYKQQPEVFQQQTNEAQPFMQYLGM